MRSREFLFESEKPELVTWYHGTDQEFTYKPNPGIWASKDFQSVVYYATQTNNEGIVYAIHLKPHKSQRIENLNDVLNTNNSQKIEKNVQSVYDDTDIRILDPNIISDMKAYRVNDNHQSIPKVAEPHRELLDMPVYKDERIFK